jgi:hypothetical protein
MKGNVAVGNRVTPAPRTDPGVRLSRYGTGRVRGGVQLISLG